MTESEYRDHLEQEVEARTRELVAARRRAEAANRAKSEFLANMSHELRTPLNAILGFSRLLVHGRNLDSEQKEHLGIINRSGEHLLGLINDVLAMSRIEAGRVSLNMSNFDLIKLLEDLREMLRLRADEKGLQLDFHTGSEVPRYIRADEVKLRQVLINLLNNALKFTVRGGASLSVESVSDGGDEQRRIIRFEVSDTGPGIDSGQLETIFDPFVQADNAERLQEGTGLGLPISRGFVRLMEGELTAESGKEEGSVFSFQIPVDVKEKSEVMVTKEGRRVVGLKPGHPGCGVLVVDDNWENRELLIRILKPMGIELHEAVNGEEALEIWRKWKPRLILMDIRMPVMDGMTATRRIRADKNGKDTVIIAVTASVFEEEMDRIKQAGCDEILRKPFREGDVFGMMERFLKFGFVYEEAEEMRSPGEESGAEADEAAPDFTVLPKGLKEKLEKACSRAEMERVAGCIDEVRRHDPRLAAALESLSERFAYDCIIALIQRK